MLVDAASLGMTAFVAPVFVFVIAVWKWRRRHAERWKALVWANFFVFAVLMVVQLVVNYLFPPGPCSPVGCL